MRKAKGIFISCIFSALFLLSLSLVFAADETLTITTYYPSPYGSYNEFKVASNTYLAYSSGNVGIGTTAPGDKLDVQGGSPADLGPGRISITGTAAYTAGLNFHTASSTRRGFVGWRGTSSTAPFNASGMYLINYDNSNLILGTNSLERVRIDTNGNVGIGTTSPDNLLTLYKTTDSSNARDFLYFRNGTYSTASMGFQGYAFYMGSPTANTAGGVIVNVATGNVGIGTSSPSVKLEVSGPTITGAPWTAEVLRWYSPSYPTIYGSLWADESGAVGGVAIGAQGGREIFIKSGAVGIGTASPLLPLHVISNATGTSPLVLESTSSYDTFSVLPYNGLTYLSSGLYYKAGSWVHDAAGTYNCLFAISGNTGGTWYASNNSTASWNVASNVTLWNSSGTWVGSSSRTLKENFTPLNPDDILQKINQLDISRWNFKSEGKSVTHIGPVAEDFYRIFKTGDAEKNLATIDSVGVSLAGVKALSVKIESQQQQIAALQSEIQQLKAKLSK